MISLIIGPMFSGKSTELIRRLNRAKIAGKRVILVRPSIDTRDSVTHDKVPVKGIEIRMVNELSEIEGSHYDVIGIDEGQFFKNLSIYANRWADAGESVIISGLDATSELTPFEEIIAVVPFAEDITKLNAVCTVCGSDYALFSHFKQGEKRGKVQVGGADLYDARCRQCFHGEENEN